MRKPRRDACGEAFAGAMPRRVAYSLAGALLALGAPLGLASVRLAQRRAFSLAAVKEDIAAERASYTYVTSATILVFAVFGRLLGREADRLLTLSTTDELTGLLNARGFNQRLQQEIARANRSNKPLSLVMVDLDGLKAINDQYGHEAGDRALLSTAQVLRRNLRVSDVAARLGGDEFAVLAADTSLETILSLAERVRDRVGQKLSAKWPLDTTASVGVVTLTSPGTHVTDAAMLLRTADHALYDAKRAGRNRVRSREIDAP